MDDVSSETCIVFIKKMNFKNIVRFIKAIIMIIIIIIIIIVIIIINGFLKTHFTSHGSLNAFYSPFT